MRRYVRLVVLAWVTASCSTWKTVPLPTAGESHLLEGHYRLTLRDQPSLVVTNPEITADSVIGPEKTRAGNVRRAVAIKDVAGVAKEGVSAARTTLLVLGIGAGLTVIAFGLLIAAYSEGIGY